jgi:hypothetical protein
MHWLIELPFRHSHSVCWAICDDKRSEINNTHDQVLVGALTLASTKWCYVVASKGTCLQDIRSWMRHLNHAFSLIAAEIIDRRPGRPMYGDRSEGQADRVALRLAFVPIHPHQQATTCDEPCCPAHHDGSSPTRLPPFGSEHYLYIFTIDASDEASSDKPVAYY